MKKRIIALLLAVVMLLGYVPVPATATEHTHPTFVVDTVTASAGETVDVTIRLENNPGITSTKLKVEYADGLTLVGVTGNPDLGRNFLVSPDGVYPVILNWYDGLADVTGDWVFATLQFTVADGADAGEYPVTISYNPNDVFDVNEDNVSFEIANGAVVVDSHYGRQQLAGMSNAKALLYAYDRIVAGVEASAEHIEVYNGADPLSVAELQMVMDVYGRDYAHHFWMDNGYSYSSDSSGVVSLMPQYVLSGSELETAKAAFEQKVAGILEGLTDSMSEYERELYLHDQLAEIITYADGDNAHNAYGALVEGKAVCEGYAEALQYLLQRAGIQSFIALGSSINPTTNSSEGHAWNYVRIDGEYYHVDLTWNDQDENLFHAYFNQTDAVIREDHAVSEVSYTLPTCDSVDAQYFTGKDTYLDDYTVAEVGRLLKNNGLTVHVYLPGDVDGFITWYYTNIVDIATEAGISGGFSYGYTRLGRELILAIATACDHSGLTLQAGADASCAADGYKAYYKCSCGKYFEDSSASVEIADLAAWKTGAGKIPASHDLTEVPATEATCEKDGNVAYFTCDCGKWFWDAEAKQGIADKNSVVIKALNHSFTNYVSDNNATCAQDGTETAKCDHCEETDTRVISGSREDAAHTFPVEYTSDGNADCTTDGTKSRVCTTCGEKETVTDVGSALGHDWDAGVVTKEPTEEETGLRLHKCTRCDETKTETIPTLDHVHKYEAVVTAPTCTAQGYTTYTCACGDSYVGDYVDALGHKYEAVVTAPTCTEEGYTTYTCACGDSYVDGYVDALGHKYRNGFCAECDAYQPCAGEGTEKSPYLISNAGNLYWFAAVVRDGYGEVEKKLDAHAKLTADITVNTSVLIDNALASDTNGFRTWTPIGNLTNAKFSGSFDGTNHEITGLYFNDESKSWVGLFGYSCGLVKNVGISDSYMNGNFWVGGVVGENHGVVSECYNAGIVIGNGSYVGGIIGYSSNGQIDNCYNTGNVTARHSTGVFVGGIVGRSNNEMISDCYNIGTVKNDLLDEDSNGSFTGGIVGYGSTVIACNNAGRIIGNESCVGGVAGAITVYISKCYNTGAVGNNKHMTVVAGIVARNYGEVTNCYNTGNVLGSTYIGGIVANNEGTVANCYNTGTVTGERTTGSIAGRNDGTVINCYALSKKEESTFDGVTKKMASQFASGEVAYLLHNGKDGSVWGQNVDGEGEKDFYPILSGEIVYKGYHSCAENALPVYTNDPTIATEKPSHKYDSSVVTAPTCTEQGYTTHTCHCGDSYVDSKVDALGHKLGDWGTVKDATCTEDGSKRRDCDRCDYFETEAIKATGHKYEEVVTAPTCTEDGYTTHTCHCGDSYVDSKVDALGHKLGDWETTKDATCTEDGSQRRDCERCDYFETEVIEATGHKYEEVVTAPTCTEQGYTTYTCHCGDSYVDSKVDALGHEYGEWTEVKAPTCDTEGQDKRICDTCGDVQYRDTRISGDPNKILVSNPVVEDYFAGKTVLLIGDSITAGVGTTKTYGEYLAESLGVTVINKGTSGSGYCSGGAMATNKHLTEANVSKADVITIMLGVNDWNWAVKDGSWNGKPGYYDESQTYYQLGDFNSTDTSTFYGALHAWCQKILAMQQMEGFEDKQFVVITPLITSWNISVGKKDWNQDKLNIHGHIFREYCTAIMEVCAYYDIPVFDANMYSGIYYRSAEDNNVAEAGGDGVHVNAAGHALLAKSLEEFLLEGYTYENRTVADCGHRYETVITQPTCTEDGYTTHKCPVCHYSYTDDYVDALGHKYESVVTAPTCTKAGYTTNTCHCGDSYVDSYVPALGHDWDAGVVTKEPTETETGLRLHNCTRCDESKTETIPTLDHAHKYEAVVTAPTCTAQGYTTHTCRCGDSHVDTYVPATGHTNVDVPAIKANSARPGMTEGVKCGVCGEILEAQQVIPAKGYDWMLDDGAFKILLIGNSYSEDASSCGQGMNESQLLNILQSMLGDDVEIVVGLAYSGGKGLNWHATQAYQEKASHSLRVISTGGKWQSKGGMVLCDALEWTDWDVVSLQHYNINTTTGEESRAYPEQTDSKFYKMEVATEYLLDYVDEFAPQADAYFYTHWAQTSAIALNAAKSNYDKMAAYIPVVMDYVGTESGNRFANLIPVGLSIQNARTTYLAKLAYNTTAYADKNLNLYTDAQIGLQRDGGHVSFNIGRYIAGLTFAETIIPEEMRVAGYVLPEIRVTESVGKLPGEYTQIAQKSVLAAVESWRNGSLAVTNIEGYTEDPIVAAEEALNTMSLTLNCGNAEKQIEMLVLAELPADFAVETIQLDAEKEMATVTVRFGYSFATVQIPFTQAKHAHTAVVTAPTCTEDGYTTYICECGDSYVDSKVDALGHKLGDWETTKDATCTEDGSKRRDCERCDYFETEVIEATGHKYEAVVTAPTCTAQGYTTHTCHCGDSYMDSKVDALGHKLGDWETAKAATCTEDGSQRRDCDRCDYFETEVIEATGHKYEIVVTAPTCTEDGYTTHTCHCGDSYVDSKVDALGHKLGDWETVKDATCTEDGSKRRDCERCDYFETEVIEATGHKYESVVTAPTCTAQGYTTYTCHCGDSYVSDYVDALGHKYESVVTAPTCTKAGYTTNTCAVCGDNDVNGYVPALGHKLGDWATTKDATCTEDGSQRRDCERCDYFETEVIEATGHKYESVVTAPTCTEEGYTTHTCHCGDSYVDSKVDALGHKLGDWETTKDATCTEDGSKRRDCDRCDYFETEVIKATGHKYESVVTAPTCTEDGYTTHTCHCGDSYVDSKVDALGHKLGDWETVKAATCTEDGSQRRDCDRCDYFETEVIEATGHKYESVVTAPTCTEEGYTTHTCACGDSYVSDYVDALGHKLGDWETVKAATCTEDGSQRRDCERCDYFETETIEATGHKYESVVTAPTCTKAGYTTNTCAVCGDNDVNDYVPALGHDWDAGVVTKEPTEEETGTRLHNCNRCDETKTVTIPTLDHVHKYEAVVTAPTCTEEGYTTHTCHCGDSYVDSKVDALGHKLGDWETTKDATCTEDGSQRRDCERCDYFETKVIEATGHKYEEVVTAPTCTEQGYTTHTCHCGDSYVDSKVDALGHKLGDWETVKAATCTEDGSKRRDCERCDYFETEVIEATGHKYEEVVTAPTCTEDGYTTHTCRCGDSYVDSKVDALGHKLGDWETVKDATCTEDGSKRRDCDRCDYFETEVIEAIGHKYETVVTAPTCTEDGYTTHTCHCGDEYIDAYVDSLGHKLGDWETVKAATCTEDGSKRRDCDRCDYFETEVIEATGHKYESVVTAPTCTEQGYTTHTCHCGDSYVDSKVDALGHKLGDWETVKAATCTEKGSERRDCANCDHFETRETDALGHDLVTHPEQKPTCVKEGWEAYEACSRCDYTTRQPIPAKGHQYSDTVIPPTCTAEGYTLRECTVCGINSVVDYVDALGHKEVILKAVAPTCTATGLTEGSYCASCGKIFAAQQVVDALGHSYKSVVTAPTCTEEGYTTYTCHCGHSYVDNKVSALGHKLGQWTVFAEPKPNADGEERRTCQRCDFYESRKVAYPGIMLKLEGEDLTKQKEVWIEGMPYPVITVGDSKYVELQDEKDFVMVTYTYQNADNPDVHTQYPTGMKVYKVSGGKITHIKELDNLLQYSGSSIRITGKKGIRMITSITKANKTALTGKGLAGYKLVEYGTALCWASEIKEGDALTLGKTFTRSNYAYKRGVADPIFATTKDLVQYTNVLVGFTNDQCKNDIAMRPYIILEDAKGEKITLYGGTVYRSIGYIAYQNRSVVKAGTEAYKYVWDIIHYVYGNKYDADYKG